MKVAAGVEMLELPAMLMNGPGVLYPTVLWDSQDVVLVDAGLPGMTPLFREAMQQAHIPFEKLNRIIVTHHDLDHIGSLGELQQSLPHPIQILSHAGEAPYIQGESAPLKLTPEMLKKMEEQMMTLPAEQQQAMRAMAERMRNQKLNVDRTISDGEVLPFCGGIQVIHTPGHTPGHVCLYLPACKTLIAGDELLVDNGKLIPAPPFINADAPMAIVSLKKLSCFDIANVIAYHGGLFQDDPNHRIEEILSEANPDAS
jgi:glyoxylase-like metal-dependent hydrolase (beta-lactamase superfamily II)